MMTEDEAKTKWCPHARVGNAEGCNRYPWDTDLSENARSPAFARCLGSDCMAWRWVQALYGHDEDGMLIEGSDPRFYGKWVNSVHGYCGLAGKP